MIKRISLLVTAALLVATMAMAGLAAPAFAVNTCNEPDPGPPPGHRTCVQGAFEEESLGASDNEKCFKKGEPVECRR